MLWHKSLWWFHPLISPSLSPQSFNLQLKTAISSSLSMWTSHWTESVFFSLCTTGCCHQIELMLVSITAQKSHFSRLCTQSLLFHSSWRNINFGFSLLADGKVLFSSFSSPVYSLSGDLKIMNECHGGTILFLIYDVFLLFRIKTRSGLSPKLWNSCKTGK